MAQRLVVLDVDGLMHVLDEMVEPWGTIKGRQVVAVRRALAGLLAKHGGERLRKENWSKLPPRVRLWLADYYQSIKDQRAVEMAESILSEVKAPSKGTSLVVPGEDPLLFQTVERLAWHYRDTGNARKAAETWLRLGGLHEKAGWWLPDSLIEAARASMQAGDKKKAEELYVRAQNSGDDFHAGGALSEHARTLIAHDRPEDARKLLEQTLQGLETNDKIETKQVIASSLLGYLHYLKGEWKEARARYEQAIERSERLSSAQLRNSVRGEVNKAQEVLGLVTQWQTRPIVCDPAQIEIVAGRDKKNEPITRRFLVSLFRDVALKVSSDNPNIKARIEESPWVEDEQPLQFEKQIALEIAPQALQKRFEAMVTRSSPQLPNFQARVPVRVEMREAAAQES